MPERQRSAIGIVLGLRNFRLLWLGEGISLLGDQFYLIALPWLVLQLTGNALAVGATLAIAGIPRALFMLLGGALTDRYSPRLVMLGSNLLRMLLVALLTGLVLAGLTQLWMLYAFALVFGLADAFFFPAQGAIVPQVVDKEHLQVGNSIIQGTAQLSRFAGPVLAGVLIAVLGGESGQSGPPDVRGIGLAFGFDAFTFLCSALTLWMIRMRELEEQSGQPDSAENVLAAIRGGLISTWNDVALRIFFLVTAAINFLVNGPILVGIPVLADSRFAEGAAAFGILMSAYGGGNLLGTILAGMLPRPAPQRMGPVLLLIISTLGIGIVLLGVIASTPPAAIVCLAMGVANGYVSILFITWLQARTPQAMLGRLMSLLMFAAVGLNPVSMALAGGLIELNPTLTFVAAGILMTTIVLLAAVHPAVRAMGMEPIETAT